MTDFARHTARIIARLGQPVTLLPNGLPERTVNAVFSQQAADAFGVIAGVQPTLRLCAADGAGLRPRDAVRVGARGYLIARIDDDGPDSGDLVLVLEAA